MMIANAPFFKRLMMGEKWKLTIFSVSMRISE